MSMVTLNKMITIDNLNFEPNVIQREHFLQFRAQSYVKKDLS